MASPADPLAAADAELRQLAAALRERGDLASYRSVIYSLVRLRGSEFVTGLDGKGAGQQAGVMTITDYCERTGRKPGAVRRAVREGRLPGVKSGGTWLVSAP